MSRQARVAVVSGFWGQNIGNAFFNVSGKWIMQQVLPDAKVEWFQDQPGYRTFHDQSKGNPPAHPDLIGALDVDYVVLQGPMLTVNFRALWEPTFRKLRERGVKVILLSSGLFRYTREEIDAAQRFLDEYPPAIFTSRDSDTFPHFKDVCDHTYDGIESAFCVPDAFKPFELDIPPTVAMCFDRYPEPTFTLGDDAGTGDPKQQGSFAFGGTTWNWEIPQVQQKLSHRGQRMAYLSSISDRRKLPATLGGWEILRPEHRSNPFVGWKVYRSPGAVVSDEPYTYLTTYANAKMTLSDRVHACVVAAAYGNPVMMFGSTPRSALFERVGLGDIRKTLVQLPEERRVQERDALLGFLTNALQPAPALAGVGS
ncbi:MAG: hypothetical protein WBA46_06005 [Thermomicrobiales bacterium]